MMKSLRIEGPHNPCRDPLVTERLEDQAADPTEAIDAYADCHAHRPPGIAPALLTSQRSCRSRDSLHGGSTPATALIPFPILPSRRSTKYTPSPSTSRTQREKSRAPR